MSDEDWINLKGEFHARLSLRGLLRLAKALAVLGGLGGFATGVVTLLGVPAGERPQEQVAAQPAPDTPANPADEQRATGGSGVPVNLSRPGSD